jgi:hypothetical protein
MRLDARQDASAREIGGEFGPEIPLADVGIAGERVDDVKVNGLAGLGDTFGEIAG